MTPSTDPAPRPPARRAAAGWWPALSLPFTLFLALPLLALLLRVSPAQVWANLGRPVVAQAIGLSLSTSLLATAVTLLFGTPLAYLMARHEFRFKRLLDSLIDLPTVLPPAVAGVALRVAYGRRGLLGGVLHMAGVELAFTPVAVVIAQTFIAAPLYLKGAMLGFAAVPPELDVHCIADIVSVG